MKINNKTKQLSTIEQAQQRYALLPRNEQRRIQKTFQYGLKEFRLKVETPRLADRTSVIASGDVFTGISLAAIVVLFMFSYTKAGEISALGNTIQGRMAHLQTVISEKKELATAYFCEAVREKHTQMESSGLTAPAIVSEFKAALENCDAFNQAFKLQMLLISLGLLLIVSVILIRSCANALNKQLFYKYSNDLLSFSHKKLQALKKEIQQHTDQNRTNKVRVLIEQGFFNQKGIDFSKAKLMFIGDSRAVALTDSAIYDDQAAHRNFKNSVLLAEKAVHKDIAFEILNYLDEIEETFLSPNLPGAFPEGKLPEDEEEIDSIAEVKTFVPLSAMPAIKPSKQEESSDEDSQPKLKIKTRKGAPQSKITESKETASLDVVFNVQDAIAKKYLLFSNDKNKSEFLAFLDSNRYGNLFSMNLVRLINREKSWNIKRLGGKHWELKCEGSERLYFEQDGVSFRFEGFSKKNDQQRKIDALKQKRA